jgi:hypothetical protein
VGWTEGAEGDGVDLGSKAEPSADGDEAAVGVGPLALGLGPSGWLETVGAALGLAEGATGKAGGAAG